MTAITIKNTKDALEILKKAVPYPNQLYIKNTNDNSIYFEWREIVFKLELFDCYVVGSKECILQRSDTSILLSELIRKETQKFYDVPVECKPKGKLISEWLKELPDGYRELALANFKNTGSISHKLVQDIGSAIHFGFDWGDTKEGDDFWYNVFNALTTNEKFPHLPKPKFEVWRPKSGELCWYLNLMGDVTSTFYHKNDSIYMHYKTKEQAQEAHEKALFNYEVEMFIKEKNEGWEPDFENNNQEKYFLYYNFAYKTFKLSTAYCDKVTSTFKYFKSKEIREEILAKFDNDKLLKWWI